MSDDGFKTDSDFERLPINPRFQGTLDPIQKLSWMPGKKFGDEQLKQMINLQTIAPLLESQGLDLDKGVIFCTEPEEVMEQKKREGKEAQLWGLRIWRENGIIRCEWGREDGNICTYRCFYNLAGYWQVLGVEQLDDVLVAHLVVQIFGGTVLVEWTVDPQGNGYWKLIGGSLIRRTDIPSTAAFAGVFQSNRHRLIGFTPAGALIAVYVEYMNRSFQINNTRHGEEPESGWTDETRPIGWRQAVSLEFFDGPDQDDGRWLATLHIVKRPRDNVFPIVEKVAKALGISIQRTMSVLKLTPLQIVEVRRVMEEKESLAAALEKIKDLAD